MCSHKITRPIQFLPHRGAAFKTTLILGTRAQVDNDVGVGAGAARSGARPTKDHPVVGRAQQMASRRQASEPATNTSSRNPQALANIAECRRPHSHSSKVFQQSCPRSSSVVFISPSVWFNGLFEIRNSRGEDESVNSNRATSDFSGGLKLDHSSV